MSSGSESDEDFVPGEPEQLSEEDSADEETDLQYENEQQQKAQKRKAVLEVKTKKKRKTQTKPVSEPKSEEKSLEDSALDSLDPEEQKKKDDELWAKFLEGTDSKPSTKAVNNVSPATESVKKANVKNNNASISKNQTASDDVKARERRIFEFAGETIVVEDNVIKEKTKTAESPAAVKIGGASHSRGGGGLSNVLGQLNRKSTLSTLEKSKLDWDTFKKDEGIEEEIQSHNKGKHGYLDRQDFLERADVRQYEIERDLRMSRRSNR